MKKSYNSPEMEIENFSVPTSIYTATSNPDPGDYNPDTEF